MAEVRYSSIDVPLGEPSDDWGRLEIWWDSAVLFGWMWFFGSVGTYLLTLHCRNFLLLFDPRPTDDTSGYIAFTASSALALIALGVQAVRRARQGRRSWPDWRDVCRSLVHSSAITAPLWTFTAVLAENYRYRLPPDGNWIAIAGFALCGLMHAFLWRYGYSYCRVRSRPFHFP